MMLIFGLGFEFPVLLVFLAARRRPDAGRRCATWRRYAIVGIFVVAAVITPSGDPITLLAMAIPMIIFYEVADPHRPRSSLPARGADGRCRLPRLRLRARPLPAAGGRRARRGRVGARRRAHRVGQDRRRRARRRPRPSPPGRKAFYTTPIKALSNQKYGDLVRRPRRRDSVGLLTGDNAINGDAPVVVMTTEVLRNMIYAGQPGARTASASWSSTRCTTSRTPTAGPVWEEVIIHLPPDVRLVCLSATVSNAEELADWISTVRGPTGGGHRGEAPGRAAQPVPGRRQELASGSTCCPTLVDGRPNPEATPARRQRRAAPEAQAARRRQPRAGGCSRPAGSRSSSALEDERHAAGDLLHLQPGRLRRRRAGLPRRRRAPHHPEERRPDPGHRDERTSTASPTPTSTCSATAAGSPGSRPASPPTTPGWCRRSRRRSRRASPRAW